MFLFLNENLCCDPSLEPSQRDETVQMMVTKYCFYGEKWLTIPKLSLSSLLIWRTGPVIRAAISYAPIEFNP